MWVITLTSNLRSLLQFLLLERSWEAGWTHKALQYDRLLIDSSSVLSPIQISNRKTAASDWESLLSLKWNVVFFFSFSNFPQPVFSEHMWRWYFLHTCNQEPQQPVCHSFTLLSRLIKAIQFTVMPCVNNYFIIGGTGMLESKTWFISSSHLLPLFNCPVQTVPSAM